MESGVHIKSHRDLIAWQKAMDLVVAVYQVTKPFPKDETYGLTSQMRRAAVSVPADIAEGQGRRQKGEYRQFLGNARVSLLELDTHLELALRLEDIDTKTTRHNIRTGAGSRTISQWPSAVSFN